MITLKDLDIGYDCQKDDVSSEAPSGFYSPKTLLGLKKDEIVPNIVYLVDRGSSETQVMELAEEAGYSQIAQTFF